MPELHGYELIAQSLKQVGVKHAYSVPGAPILETLTACIKEGIRPISVRNEQAGVMMAAAENYVAGFPSGVPILVAGPGVTNAVTGTLIAWDNCWPLVVLGGRQALGTEGMGTFQELNSAPIFQTITKWSSVIQSIPRIPEYIFEAFQIATSGRPGPVYLDLPLEIIRGTTDSEKLKPAEWRPYSPQPGDPSAIREAAKLLLQAERPLMLLGKGVRWSEPYAELKQLVETLNMPFVTSPMGRGYIPDDHPLNFNAARTFAQRNADVVLMAGGRFNWIFRFGNDLAPDAKVVQIDIDPEEIGHNRPVAAGIVGDIKMVLAQLLKELQAKKSGLAERSKPVAWLSSLQAKRDENEQSLVPFLNSDIVPMTTHRLLKEVREFIPRDAICVVDGQLILAAGRQSLPSYTPASRLNSGTNGCIGTGVPFGIGAKIARPERMVVSICGDCSFGFSATEMETALRHKLPVIFIVEENEGIEGTLLQERIVPKGYTDRVTSYSPDIRYDLIMQAFGGHAEYVQRPEELKPALQRAVASGMASCINVKVNPRTPFPGPDGRPRRSMIMMSY